MTKSFKDNYDEMRVTKETIVTPFISPVVIEPVKTILPETNAVNMTPEIVEPVKEPAKVKEITTESIIKKVLTEQREQSAKVLESVMTSNKRLSTSLSKIVKESTATNAMLVEAITALANKIELLEAKLDVIKDLEIPTPVVHVQMPSTKVNREVHRDTKGLITHITESEVADDGDE